MVNARPRALRGLAFMVALACAACVFAADAGTAVEAMRSETSVAAAPAVVAETAAFYAVTYSRRRTAYERRRRFNQSPCQITHCRHCRLAK